MPIIASSELARRRAARAAAAEQLASAVRPTVPDTAPGEPRAETHIASAGAEASPVPVRAKQRGHAIKDKGGKWQPTAGYSSGFARPPEHSRFKEGGKPGPGRPKGSLSHDALLAKHLNQKREVSLNGRRQRLTARELLIITTLKSALEGKDKNARAYVLAQNERLFPPKEVADGTTSALSLSASDALSIAEFEQEIYERLREELSDGVGFSEGERQ